MSAYSALSDDQLLQLLRELVDEAMTRNPGTSAAANQIGLDAAEKLRIAQIATEQELGAMRARERERIAAEARAKVQAEAHAQTTEARRKQIESEAQRAIDAEAKRNETWQTLRKALTDALGAKCPSQITIVILRSKRASGMRLIVNRGNDQYRRDHLVDFEGGKLSTVSGVDRPALIRACVALIAEYPTGLAVVVSGINPKECANV